MEADLPAPLGDHETPLTVIPAKAWPIVVMDPGFRRGDGKVDAVGPEVRRPIKHSAIVRAVDAATAPPKPAQYIMYQ